MFTNTPSILYKRKSDFLEVIIIRLKIVMIKIKRYCTFRSIGKSFGLRLLVFSFFGSGRGGSEEGGVCSGVGGG